MRILITGAAGLYGAHLIDELLRRRTASRIIALDNFSGSYLKRPPFLPHPEFTERVEIVKRDFRTLAARSLDAMELAAVAHLAVRITIDESIQAAHSRTALVTGGAGFIGRWIVQRLIEEGHRVAGAVTRGAVLLDGEGAQERDFLYLDDAVAALVAAARDQTPGLRTLNIGTGCKTGLADLAARLGQALGRPIVAEKSGRPEQPPRCIWLNVEAAARVLNWSASVSLPAGLRQAAAWRLSLSTEKLIH